MTEQRLLNFKSLVNVPLAFRFAFIRRIEVIMIIIMYNFLFCFFFLLLADVNFVENLR